MPIRWQISPPKFHLLLICFIFLLGTSVLDGQQTEESDSPFANQLETHILELVKHEMVPGAAVLVVKGDQTLFNKGFGFADIEKGRPVTPDTRFYIASSTKSFTGLAAALCAERDELDLDQKLSKSLSDASYHGQIDPSKISLRELLTHTHGIDNNGPVSFRAAYSGQQTPDKLKQLLKYHGASEEGKSFRYGNIGYNVAGLVLQNELGLHWKDLLQREIFGPLQMDSTTGFVTKVDRDTLAMPYSMEAEGFKKMHYAKSDSNMHAAGGLVTTTHDLAQWLKANINHGKIGGQQILSQRAFETAHHAHSSQDASYMSFKRTGYGLGWNTGEYDGDQFVHHFGGFSGFHCHISFMPKHKLGVAILVNTSSGSLFADTVSRFAYDSLLNKADMEERFSSVKKEEVVRQLEGARERIGKDRARRAARSQVLPNPLSAYAGTYRNDQYGRIVFRESDGKLTAEMGPLWSAVEVFDGSKNALRIELTGSGEVAKFNFDDEEKAKSVECSGLVFRRVDP